MRKTAHPAALIILMASAAAKKPLEMQLHKRINRISTGFGTNIPMNCSQLQAKRSACRTDKWATRKWAI